MSTELRVSENGSLFFLSLVCLVASIGGLLFGFDTAVISGTVDFVEAQFELSKVQLGWFTSSALIGCIIGALPAGILGDRFGRKPMLIISAVLFFISALLSAVVVPFWALIPARLIGGVGVGMASVLAPMLISEYAPSAIRGRLGALYQLSIVTGILTAYLCNWLLLRGAAGNVYGLAEGGLLHWVLVSEVWRGMFGAEMLPAALFFLLMFAIPESPRWLVVRGRDRLALDILAKVGGRTEAERQVGEIRQSLALEKGNLMELFRPGWRLALLLGVGLSFFGQLTGVNIIIYYGPTIIKAAGFQWENAMLIQVILGIINFLFTLLAIAVIDSWGRRRMLISGMAAITLTLVATGILYLSLPGLYLLQPGLNVPVATWVGGAIIVLLCVYIGCLAFSICGVIWVLTPEIYPNRLRGSAAAIATFVNWSTNAASAFLFLIYVDKYGMGTGFLTFAAICFVATIFFYRLVPETKGKSLEEIERYWISREG